jgi:hypothetical protein
VLPTTTPQSKTWFARRLRNILGPHDSCALWRQRVKPDGAGTPFREEEPPRLSFSHTIMKSRLWKSADDDIL